MKRILVLAFSVVGLLIAAFVVAVVMRPGHVHVERSTIVEGAAVEDVEPLLRDLRAFNEWSPWDALDPDMERTYSEKTDEVGSVYAWKGNDEVGTGSITITGIEPGKITMHLRFVEPFEDEADASLRYEPAGDGVKVTWTFDQDLGFMGKAMSLFMDFDEMLGKDYEKGLSNLKSLAIEAAGRRKAAAATGGSPAAAME